MCPYNSRQQTPGWSSVSVFKTNLLPYSLKHTHTQKYTDLHTSRCNPPRTHTFPTASICSYLCAEMRRRAQRCGWMDSGQIAKGGKRRLDVYIIHAGMNALFVTVVTSTSISPSALCLLVSLGAGNAMNLCVFLTEVTSWDKFQSKVGLLGRARPIEDTSHVMSADLRKVPTRDPR